MYACQISVALHAAVGMATCATPDGRLCNTALADGSMSAYPGTDRNGPYALMASSCCWDQSKSQNSQMNMKFHPTAVNGPNGLTKLKNVMQTYFAEGGMELQLNIVSSDTLRDAQKHPDKYKDLVVRVAGFSAYFVEVFKDCQNDLIRRTEQGL